MITHTSIEIHECDREDFERMADYHNVGKKWWGKHLRGFRAGNDIYIKKGKFGELALIAHEIGHIKLGLKHTKWPTIMNFSGLFRWFAL